MSTESPRMLRADGKETAENGPGAAEPRNILGFDGFTRYSEDC